MMEYARRRSARSGTAWQEPDWARRQGKAGEARLQPDYAKRSPAHLARPMKIALIIIATITVHYSGDAPVVGSRLALGGGS